MKNNICCFFGHRTINETAELKVCLFEVIEKLIVDEKLIRSFSEVRAGLIICALKSCLR